MQITTELIKSFKPCADRFNNFKSNYPNYNNKLEDFLSLDKISFNDKIWVSVRLMTDEQKITYALKCAESVLHIYEKLNNDGVLRKELNAYMLERTEENRTKLKIAANAAANAAYADAAAHAAYASAAANAAYASAYADAAAHANTAAAYAAYAADAADAAYANTAAAARETQEALNLLFVVEVLK